VITQLDPDPRKAFSVIAETDPVFIVYRAEDGEVVEVCGCDTYEEMKEVIRDYENKPGNYGTLRRNSKKRSAWPN
jgi:hypothetical protein